MLFLPLLIGAGVSMAQSAIGGIAASKKAKAESAAAYRNWQEEDLKANIAVRQYNRQAARNNEDMRENYRNAGKSAADAYARRLVGITREANSHISSVGRASGDLIARNMALADAKNTGGNSGLNQAFVRTAALNTLNTLTTVKLDADQARRDSSRRYDADLKSRQYQWTAPKTYIPGPPPPQADTGSIMAGALLSGAIQAGGSILGGIAGSMEKGG